MKTFTGETKKVFEIIAEYLKKEDITLRPEDCYSPEEWEEREEPYGQGGVLVITYDGGDHGRFFSLDRGYELGTYAHYEKLSEHLKNQGYFWEEGTCWHCTIYKD